MRFLWLPAGLGALITPTVSRHQHQHQLLHQLLHQPQHQLISLNPFPCLLASPGPAHSFLSWPPSRLNVALSFCSLSCCCLCLCLRCCHSLCCCVAFLASSLRLRTFDFCFISCEPANLHSYYCVSPTLSTAYATHCRPSCPLPLSFILTLSLTLSHLAYTLGAVI